MKVRRFVADSFAEAFSRIRAEMGADAYILSTRTLRAYRRWPWSTASGSHQVVVTAALPPDGGTRARPRPRVSEQEVSPCPPSVGPQKADAVLTSALGDEGVADSPRPSPPASCPGTIVSTLAGADRPRARASWLDRLDQAGWQQDLVAWIEKEWQRQSDQLNPGDWLHCVRPWLVEELSSCLRVSQPWLELPARGVVVVSAGAEGSGGAEVGRQVTDSYHQIAGWRTLLQPLEVSGELATSWSPTPALRRQYDLIWVQLPPIDRLSSAQLQQWVAAVADWRADEIHWVVSAASADGVSAVWPRVARLVPTHLTVTAIQRPEDYRFAYVQAWRRGLSLRFLASQPADASAGATAPVPATAPPDLEIADAVQLVEKMVSGVEAGATDQPRGTGLGRNQEVDRE